MAVFAAALPCFAATCETTPGVTCAPFPGRPQMAHYSRVQPDSRPVLKKLLNLDAPPFAHSIALLFGVSTYNTLTALPFVRNDIRDMRQYLLNEEQFDDVYVISDRDVDANSLRDLVVNTFVGSLVNKNDRFLFYYSGHGSPQADGTGHMLLWGSQAGKYTPDWDLPVSEIQRWSNRMKDAGHVLFLLDGCALGLGLVAKSGAERAMVAGDGSRMAYAATRGGENSYGTRDNQHSIFTQELLKVLRSPDSDKEGFGYVTIQTAAALMQNGLAAALKGSSEWKPVWPETLDPARTGSFLFLRTPRNTTPVTGTPLTNPASLTPKSVLGPGDWIQSTLENQIRASLFDPQQPLVRPGASISGGYVSCLVWDQGRAYLLTTATDQKEIRLGFPWPRLSNG